VEIGNGDQGFDVYSFDAGESKTASLILEQRSYISPLYLHIAHPLNRSSRSRYTI
jgi:hypothetical protein